MDLPPKNREFSGESAGAKRGVQTRPSFRGNNGENRWDTVFWSENGLKPRMDANDREIGNLEGWKRLKTGEIGLF